MPTYLLQSLCHPSPNFVKTSKLGCGLNYLLRSLLDALQLFDPVSYF
jgi:hypothetical protein